MEVKILAIEALDCGHSASEVGELVGVKEVDDNIWLVSFMQYDLGFFELLGFCVTPLFFVSVVSAEVQVFRPQCHFLDTFIGFHQCPGFPWRCVEVA